MEVSHKQPHDGEKKDSPKYGKAHTERKEK